MVSRWCHRTLKSDALRKTVLGLNVRSMGNRRPLPRSMADLVLDPDVVDAKSSAGLEHMSHKQRPAARVRMRATKCRIGISMVRRPPCAGDSLEDASCTQSPTAHSADIDAAAHAQTVAIGFRRNAESVSRPRSPPGHSRRTSPTQSIRGPVDRVGGRKYGSGILTRMYSRKTSASSSYGGMTRRP